MKKQRLSLEIEDKIYIYEEFHGSVVEYTIIGIFVGRNNVEYHIEAYDKHGEIFNYRTCDEDEIGKTAFLTLEAAEEHRKLNT